MNNANLSAEEILAEEVYSDFERRRAERKNLERSWQLNLNFVNGNQYCLIDAKGEIAEEEKNYYWQERLVFNHIAPIVAARLAKLSRIRPALTVRAASDDETDRRSAELASRILAAAHDDGDLDGVMNTAAMWSETCGTAFYKVVWNSAKGRLIGLTDDGNPLKEGEVEVVAVSPFEIYPFSLTAESVAEQPSIIHAKPLPVEEIFSMYGVKVSGRDKGEFNLVSGALNYGCPPDMQGTLSLNRCLRPSQEAFSGRA